MSRPHFLQHHAKVDVHGTMFRGLGAGFAIVLLDCLKRRPATAVVPMVDFTVVPELGHVTDCRDFHIRLLEQITDVGDALPAGADDGYVQLLAGGRLPGPAQDVSRNDYRGGQCRRSGDESSTAQLWFLSHVSIPSIRASSWQSQGA